LDKLDKSEVEKKKYLIRKKTFVYTDAEKILESLKRKKLE
jgi:hypothetical protein